MPESGAHFEPLLELLPRELLVMTWPSRMGSLLYKFGWLVLLCALPIEACSSGDVNADGSSEGTVGVVREALCVDGEPCGSSGCGLCVRNNCVDQPGEPC